MKKIIKAVGANIFDLLGNEAIQGRSITFKVLVATLVLGVSFFILFNLLQLAL